MDNNRGGNWGEKGQKPKNLEHKVMEEEAKLPRTIFANVSKEVTSCEALQVTLASYFLFTPQDSSTGPSKQRAHNSMKSEYNQM